jgi:ferrous iron transport protein A
LNLTTPTRRLKRSSLKEARTGARVRVVELKSDPAVCQRLREMGFCEFAEVSKICDHGPCICTVCGSRVALSPALAESIVVREIEELAAVPAPAFC